MFSISHSVPKLLGRYTHLVFLRMDLMETGSDSCQTAIVEGSTCVPRSGTLVTMASTLCSEHAVVTVFSALLLGYNVTENIKFFLKSRTIYSVHASVRYSGGKAVLQSHTNSCVALRSFTSYSVENK